MRGALAMLAAVVSSACGDGDVSPSAADDHTEVSNQKDRPRIGDASYDPFVPFETLSDWVSYSDAIVVLTVTDEIPPVQRDELGRAGSPAGQSIRIDETAWQHAPAPTPTPTIELQGGMLYPEPRDGPPIWYRLASVGDQYLVGLAQYDQYGWMTTTPALTVSSGRLTDDVRDTHPLAGALAQLDLAAVGDALADATPDPVAERARPGDPLERWEAVIAAM